jgi:hypothetical protein
MSHSSSLQQFHSSYLIQTGCQLSEEEQQRIQNIEEFRPIDISEVISESQESESDESESEESSSEQQTQSRRRSQPQLKTIMRDVLHQTCFSKSPVKQCSRHGYATSIQPESIVFACLDREDIQTEILKIKVLRGETVSVSSLPASYTETESVPQTCAQL